MLSIKQNGKQLREWCADRRIEFKIITEDELGIRTYGKKKQTKKIRWPFL